MIRLIASDLAGTLLNDKKQLPPDFFEVLDALEEKGVRFTVSSGRTYNAVQQYPPPSSSSPQRQTAWGAAGCRSAAAKGQRTAPFPEPPKTM